ncbi:MAG: hypothetical protein GF329_02255 [Candidatus Lokiarchaeota archaeon]|nr:hypothetical protein [Candidatus Lokiarchaeota archaeon]
MINTDRKPSWLRLPCSRCYIEIPELIEGVTLRCLQCNTENTFTESERLLERLAKDVFGEVPSIDFIESQEQRLTTIQERETKLINLMKELEKEEEEIQKHAIVATPIEKYGVSARKMLELVKKYNKIAILAKNYCLPLPMTVEEGANSRDIYYSTSFKALIHLGTFNTIRARRASENTEATKLYDQAARNFNKAAEIANDAIEAGYTRFKTKKALADAVNKYATGLASITRGNPDYATRKFKEVRSILDDIISREPRAKIDNVRCGMIVSLQPSIKMILKQLKEGKVVREASKVRLYPLDKSKEIIDTVRDAKEWITKQQERFDGIVDFYYKLNYKEKLDYIKRYQNRFKEFSQIAKNIFDETVRDIVKNLAEEYSFKVGQLFRRLDSAAKTAVLPGESTREQFDEGRGELEAIDELYKSVMATLIDTSYSIKKTEFATNAENAIKESHDQFDQLVRTAITQLILDYDESSQRVFDRLGPIADSAKLPGDEVIEYFRDSRAELDSLGFTISSLVDVSYNVERKEFSERIRAVQSRQHVTFDSLVRRAIINLIGDYAVTGKKLVLSAIPISKAAGALGEKALEQMAESKKDIDGIDIALEETLQELTKISYEVKRFEFSDDIIDAQYNRDRDFVDSVRTAVKSLLTFKALPRFKMIKYRKELVNRGESAMAKGNYVIAAQSFADAAKLSQELGETERAKELEEKAKGMERLASMIS